MVDSIMELFLLIIVKHPRKGKKKEKKDVEPVVTDHRELDSLQLLRWKGSRL